MASENFIENHVNRHPSQLFYATNLFDNNFNLLNFNSSVEFAISSGIPSGEGPYHIKSSLKICSVTASTGSSIVGDFSGGYS